MESYQHDKDVPPRQVELFSLLWLGGMVIGGAYDCIVAIVGDHLEACSDILLFAAAGALMYCAVRRRSNFARLMLTPFIAVNVVEVLSHEGPTASALSIAWLPVLQLALMASAAWLLFTPAARSWYTRGARQ